MVLTGLLEMSVLREWRVLDHYIVKLVNGCLGVVVGNMHSHSHLIGYVKYCISDGESIWRDRFHRYRRLVNIYSADKVYDATPWEVYTPCYDQTIPAIPWSKVVSIHDPLERLISIIRSPKDMLEYKVAKLVENIFSSGSFRNIGITGSILAGIHSVEYSDIDLVIYDWRDSVNIIEYIVENPSIFRGFEGDSLRSWGYRVASSTGLSLEDVLKFYRRWRRGFFDDREYSLIYNDGVYRELDNCIRWRSLGVYEAYVELAGGLDALNYPSTGLVEKTVYARGVEPRGDPLFIVSFEALYTPALYEGGRFYVRGLLQHNIDRDLYRLIVGVREAKSFIRYV